MNDEVKASLIEWLILFGRDWVDYNRQLHHHPFRFNMGSATLADWLDYEKIHSPDTPYLVYRYRLNDKALKLLEEA
jgi:hypothetical protein